MWLQLILSSVIANENKPFQVIVIKAKKIPFSQILTPSYSSLSLSQVEALQYSKIKDVLQQEPGFLIVQSGGMGQQVSAFVRGMNSNHIQVRIDGMKATPPNSPNGSYDFSDFTSDGAQSIEMIRGAVTSLYGADAVGGIISVKSMKGEETPQSLAYTEIGTAPSQRVKASFSGDFDNTNLVFSVGIFHTSGNIGKSPYLQQAEGNYPRLPYTLKNYVLCASTTLSNSTEFTFFSRYYEASLLYQELALAVPQARSQALNRFEVNHSISNSWSHQIGLGILVTSSENAKTFDTYSKSKGQRLTLNWGQKFSLSQAQSIQTSIELERDEFNEHSKHFASRAHGQTLGGGLIYRWLPFSVLALEFSARKDLNNAFHSPFCYRVGAAYKTLSLRTEFFTSLATAFKAPTLYELYGKGAYFTGNTALKPENVKAYEVGVKQPIGQFLTVTVIYFHNHLKHLIEYNFIEKQMQNIAKAETKGLETIISLNVTSEVKIETNHTFVQAQNKLTGYSLTRRPRHKRSLRISHVKEELQLSMEGIYVGKRQDHDPLNYNKIVMNKSYKTFSMKAVLKWTETLVSFFRVENLFNKKIEEPLGYKQPGITGYVGLQVKI